MTLKLCSNGVECLNRAVILQLKNIMRLGLDMRAKQNAYFRTRGHSALIASKRAEQAFDKAVSDFEGSKLL